MRCALFRTAVKLNYTAQSWKQTILIGGRIVYCDDYYKCYHLEHFLYII